MAVERTSILAKPDAVERKLAGEILARFERRGLKAGAARLVVASRELGETHYAEHSEKPFFGELVDFITSGPTLAFVLEGEGRSRPRARRSARRTPPTRPGHAPRRLRAGDAEQPRARLGLARVGRARDRALVPRWAGLSDARDATARLDEVERRVHRRAPATRGRSTRSSGASGTARSPSSTSSATSRASTSSSSAAARPTSPPGSRGAGTAVGVDVTPAQLDTARRLQGETGIEFPLLEADAGATGLPDACFDLALSEYGASIWFDPYRWVPEAARLLRPGGGLCSSALDRLSLLCSPRGPGRRPACAPQFGMHRLRVGTRTASTSTSAHGEWIDVLRENGFEVERLHRAPAPAGARSTRTTTFVTAEWARKWPAEEIWVARKR